MKYLIIQDVYDNQECVTILNNWNVVFVIRELLSYRYHTILNYEHLCMISVEVDMKNTTYPASSEKEERQRKGQPPSTKVVDDLIGDHFVHDDLQDI